MNEGIIFMEFCHLFPYNICILHSEIQEKKQAMIKEIQAKSLLRKHKRVDSWFISCYEMNIYRGCAHNCTYCDGRSEGYYVEGEFGLEF